MLFGSVSNGHIDLTRRRKEMLLDEAGEVGPLGSGAVACLAVSSGLTRGAAFYGGSGQVEWSVSPRNGDRVSRWVGRAESSVGALSSRTRSAEAGEDV